MALPRMTPQRLEAFRADVAKRHTEKVQRSIVRKLLQSNGARAKPHGVCSQVGVPERKQRSMLRKLLPSTGVRALSRMSRCSE